MKVNKKFFLPTIGLLAFTMPILLGTLTSCNQTWAYTTPIICGTNYVNDEHDPFFNFRNDELYDKDNESLSTYLPSNYVFLKSSDGKNNSFYGYTAPVKSWIEDEGKATASKKAYKDYQIASDCWYQLVKEQNNPDFPIQYQIKDSSQILFNYHNYEITKSISLVNSIAQSLSFMIDNAFTYQQSFLNKSDQKNEEKITNAWGCAKLNFNFDHGNKDSQENADFYEFLFANANFHAIGKSNAFLKTSAINFNFHEDYFPIATYENNKFTNKFKKLLEDDKQFNSFKETETTKHYWTSNDKPITIEKFWINGSQQEYKNVVKQTYYYQNVPIIINPVSLIKTYLNPTCSSSFLVGDYYQNNASVIKDTIGNSWQDAGIGSFVGTKLTGPSHKSFEIKMNNNNPITFSNSKDNRLPNDINANCFIGLLNCNVDEYSLGNEVLEQSCDISLANIFPAYFLKDYEDLLTNSVGNDVYTIDNNTLNKHLEDMVKLHTRKSEDGQQIDPKDVKDQSLLSFLGYLFANKNNNIQTKDFIQPFEKI